MSAIISVLDVFAYIFAVVCEVVGVAVAATFFVALFCVIMSMTDRG